MTTLIEFIFHDGQKQEFSTEKTSIILGRGTNCDIVLPFDGISRQHAQFEFIEGEVFVTDLGSTNGILVDGKKIPAKKRTAYQTFLNLQFGPFQSIVVHLKRDLTRSIRFNTLDLISKKGQDEVTNNLESPLSVTAKVKGSTRIRPQRIEKNQSNSGMVLLMVMAITGGAVYFQFFREGPDTSVQKKSSLSAAAVVAPIESQFKTKTEIISLLPKFNCREAMKEVCAYLHLKADQGEGAYADGPNLLALVNMSLSETSSVPKEFADMISTDRYEVYLLDKLHTSSAISLIARNTTYSNLQLIGYLDKEPAPVMNLKLNKDLQQNFMDPLVIGSLLDDVRTQGLSANLETIRPQYKLKEY